MGAIVSVSENMPLARARVRLAYLCLSRGLRVRACATEVSMCVTTSLKRADISVSISGRDHPEGFWRHFSVSFRMCIFASVLRETVTPFATVCAGVSFSSRVKDGSNRETRCKATDKILVVFETSKAII